MPVHTRVPAGVVPSTYEEWLEAYGATPARDAEFQTLSGDDIKPLYTEADLPVDRDGAIGVPGGYPFTRGVYPSMYRGRLWTMRQ
ncbi:MAG: methylmalonyl-CoA mutase, N-terminal domain, partial [Solirubrobacteraceae bacterium]|nr:methylmalonyl-CoA mutase, N-terminal domain [Solirubrobacteraceae bacterium]